MEPKIIAELPKFLKQYEASFLATETWQIVLKKIARSKKAWGEV